MLFLVVDLLVIVLIAVLLAISFGISTKVIWSAIIAPSLYFFITILSLDISQPEIMLNKSKLPTGKVSLLLSHFVCRHATFLPKIGSQKERCVTTKKMAAYWTRKGCIKKNK